jgi:RNA polymerase sigma-70 factor (ECF subfamily)
MSLQKNNHEDDVLENAVDSRLFEALVESYSDSLWRFARSIVKDDDLAEDILQETFLYIWKNRISLNKNRNIKSFLFTIVRSRSIDSLRKNKRMIVFSDMDDDDDSEYAAGIEDEGLLAHEIFDKKVDERVVKEALNTLSESERLIISLHIVECMTFDDVADILKKPLNTVKSTYRRSLMKLKGELAPKYEQ